MGRLTDMYVKDPREFNLPIELRFNYAPTPSLVTFAMDLSTTLPVQKKLKMQKKILVAQKFSANKSGRALDDIVASNVPCQH